MQKGEPLPSLVAHFLVNGGQIDVEVKATLVQFEGRSSVQIQLRDVTDRKRMEVPLKESEERFRLIIANSPVGYFELDIQGGMVFFNDATCEILGYSREELSGKKYGQLIDIASSHKISAAFEDVLKTGQTAKSVDWVLIRKDNARRFAEASISLLKGP